MPGQKDEPSAEHRNQKELPVSVTPWTYLVCFCTIQRAVQDDLGEITHRWIGKCTQSVLVQRPLGCTGGAQSWTMATTQSTPLVSKSEDCWHKRPSRLLNHGNDPASHTQNRLLPDGQDSHVSDNENHQRSVLCLITLPPHWPPEPTLRSISSLNRCTLPLDLFSYSAWPPPDLASFSFLFPTRFTAPG
jgi:hypothetical protein